VKLLSENIEFVLGRISGIHMIGGGFAADEINKSLLKSTAAKLKVLRHYVWRSNKTAISSVVLVLLYSTLCLARCTVCNDLTRLF